MPPADKLTILFLAANPAATNQLQLDEEMRAIDAALRKAAFRDRFALHSHWALRYADLPEILLRYNPHIVHFSGHGSEKGELVFAQEGGGVHHVPPAALSDLFDLLRDNIGCVVLNACYSEGQAQGIAESIDCVVGMESAVADSAAIEFAAGFYTGLGFGRSIKTAFGLGRNRMAALGGGEESIPKLLALRSDPAALYLLKAEAGGQAASGGGPGAPAVQITGTNVGRDLNIEVRNSLPPQERPVQERPVQVGNTVVPYLRELRGKQLQAALQALLSAYPSEAELTHMVFIHLDENLAAVAGGGNLKDKIFNLLEWARMRGRLTELLQGAVDGNPGSVDLQELIAALS